MRLRLLFILLFAATLFSQSDKPTPSINTFTSSMRAMPGYFPLYWDDHSGKLYLEIDKWSSDFLYVDSLAAGMGSNDIGLDRAQPGEARVVQWQRIGPKVLLIEQNLAFRSSATDPSEKRDIADSFATSALWGGTIVASDDDGKRALVDATPLFLSDAHHAIEALKRTKQGAFSLDEKRSAIYLPNTKNFPQNTEVEATLTLTGTDPGEWVRDVTPEPHAITIREHQSLIQLPDDGYTPRRFDPRAGYFPTEYIDYSAPIGADITQRFIVRHRLQKKDPNAAISDPVQPIVYYLDPGTPEPVRSALLDGARWWNAAFEAAGFRNAFRVEMLPPDADPMDVRYNMINWIHRATRGWSYGAAIVDPRTGEIIKGNVLLGSLRMRQDYMILEGLLSPYKSRPSDAQKQVGQPNEAQQNEDPRILQVVLERLRQLAAHEVGHTLGLSHNYIASTQGNASVMDYPHPLVTLDNNGGFDLSNAYPQQIGAWDKVAIAYGYSEFPNGTNEREALDKIISDARAHGLTFLTDQDARPPGSAQPFTHLWDNGKDPIAELDRVMQVRARALQNFSEAAIRVGEPLAHLEDVLVPVYLFHRYQTEAAVKTIGGQNYSYAVRGDGQTPVLPVPADRQRDALRAVLATISPEALAVPKRITDLIPPHPAGYERTRENFTTNTGMTFDPLAAAESAAHDTVALLLNRERAARLEQAHAADPSQLGFGEVLDRLIAVSWSDRARPASGRAVAQLNEVQRRVGDVVLDEMMRLASDTNATNEVRAITLMKLRALASDAGRRSTPIFNSDDTDRAHWMWAAAQIHKFELQPSDVLKPREPVTEPPGAPIGTPLMDSDSTPDFSINGSAY